MKRPRRQFLYLAAGAAALSATSHIARAQTYRKRPTIHVCDIIVADDMFAL
jgi:hypothetical protein